MNNDTNDNNVTSNANNLAAGNTSKAQSPVSGDDLVALSNRAADHPKPSNQMMSEDAMNDLKSEIKGALSGVGVPVNDPSQNIVTSRNDSVVELEASDKEIPTGKAYIPEIFHDLPITAKANPITTKHLADDLPITPKANKVSTPDHLIKEESITPTTAENSILDNVAQDNHDALVASLKNDIQSELKDAKGEASVVKNNRPTDTGIKQTYFSDLSSAMGSNEPATMSELLSKSRFEKKEAKILSLRSRKNIAFIGGATVLLLASIAVLSLFFGSDKKIEFITQEKVDSLVRSNQDTGINVTNLESSRIKQAIRDVIEIDIPEDAINQIYYVEKDQLDNLRRLGIKDIFDKTNNQTPPTLYDNVENNFTHGVYSTDKNYPFIILKTLSYDRALDGLLEWEPTIIDDLATYLDLPPEATDRSLIKPGFEDDILRNKNVRVARFLPREVDRRGIFDFLQGNSDDKTPAATVEPVDGEGLSVFGALGNMITRLVNQPVFAQTENTPQTGGTSFGNIGNNNLNDSSRTCYNNNFLGESFDSTYEGRAGYYCVNSVGTDDSVDVRISRTAPVCFNPVTGDRVPDELNQDGSIVHNTYPAAFCFEAYKCYAYRCYVGDVAVAEQSVGQQSPGYNCRTDIAGGAIFHESDPRQTFKSSASLSCTQFTGLTQLTNVDNALLCFDDETGELTEDIGAGVSCVSAPVVSDESIWAEQAIDTSTCGEITNNGEFQERLIQASFGLRVISTLGWYLGLSGFDVQNMNAIADFLADVAYGDQTNLPALNEALEVVRQLDLILSDIDPYLELPQTGPSGGLNVYGQLLNIINIIKCVFNVGGNLQWLTSDAINTDVPIYAGQSVESMEPIQKTLVQIGLMDPLSISGTLDIVTQDAVSQFQDANGLNVTGILDLDTLALIESILDNQGTIINTGNSISGQAAIIANYFLESKTVATSDNALQIGAYNTTVQDLQIVLYAEGYDISAINGLFTTETCEAVQDFEQDEGLEITEPVSCVISFKTLEALDSISRLKGYVGSGFSLNPQGFLQGEGSFEGIFGPGVTSFANTAEADTLNEGDIVLMYTFLDEKTILITRDEVVINEVVKRRALSDIFK
jgi:peptidoglycan hydrolase-like protein with peptidoglycan-binding domain